MFKKSKKLIALFCAAALCASLVACKEKKQDSGVTEVKVWSDSRGSKALMTELVDEWNKTVGKEKGIKIVYEVLTGNGAQQVEVALQSGTAADIIGSSNMQQRVELGYLEPIDTLEGGEEFLKQFSDRVSIQNCKVGDHYYTVPSTSIVAGLLYNKDIFKAGGVVDENGEPKPPATYDELIETAKKLTDKSKKQYGIIFPGKSTGTWFGYEVKWPMMSSVGHDGFDPEKNTYDYSGLKPILEAVMQLKKDGSCYPGTEAIDADPARARFAEGAVAMKFGMSWDVGVLTDQFPAKCDWGVAPLPVLDTENSYKQRMDMYNGFAMTTFKEGKDPQKVFEVFKFLHSDEVRKEFFARGIGIPYHSSLTEGVDTSKAPKQWAEFAKLLEISTAAPMAIKTDTTGETKLEEMFVNDVWNGSVGNIDSILEKWSDVCNKGMKLYEERNKGYDPKTVDNSGFNPSR